jgi:hypothetical protein
MQRYTTETKVYYQSGSSPSDCNSILFINTGTTNVNVEGLVLTPAQSWSVDGNENEINVKYYNFVFNGVGNNSLTIIIKRFI